MERRNEKLENHEKRAPGNEFATKRGQKETIAITTTTAAAAVAATRGRGKGAGRNKERRSRRVKL